MVGYDCFEAQLILPLLTSSLQVIVACRHLVSANQPETLSFRYRMVNFMDDLLDESVLIGTGWTNKEGSRSLAYSTLADLIHQVCLGSITYGTLPPATTHNNGNNH